MGKDTIKLSEIKRLNIKEGDCLVIKDKPNYKDNIFDMAEHLAALLKVVVVIVENFDDLRVISKSKLKK